MSTPTIDPVGLTVIWNGLLSIAEEMGSTLRRTVFPRRCARATISRPAYSTSKRG